MAADKIEELLRSRLLQLGKPDIGQRNAEYRRTWDLLKSKAMHADGSVNTVRLEPTVARMGCEFGSSKPEKPSDDEIAQVEKVLAVLN